MSWPAHLARLVFPIDGWNAHESLPLAVALAAVVLGSILFWWETNSHVLGSSNTPDGFVRRFDRSGAPPGKAVAAEDDSSAEDERFEASATWQGSRPGYYFGRGRQGVGYYWDTASNPNGSPAGEMAAEGDGGAPGAEGGDASHLVEGCEAIVLKEGKHHGNRCEVLNPKWHRGMVECYMLNGVQEGHIKAFWPKDLRFAEPEPGSDSEEGAAAAAEGTRGGTTTYRCVDTACADKQKAEGGEAADGEEDGEAPVEEAELLKVLREMTRHNVKIIRKVHDSLGPVPEAKKKAQGHAAGSVGAQLAQLREEMGGDDAFTSEAEKQWEKRLERFNEQLGKATDAARLRTLEKHGLTDERFEKAVYDAWKLDPEGKGFSAAVKKIGGVERAVLKQLGYDTGGDD